MTKQAHTIPPQSGRGFRLKTGEHLKIVDPEGQQIADMWAIVPDDPLDWLSVSQTRDISERFYPTVVESFFSVHGQKLLTLVEDGSLCPTTCSFQRAIAHFMNGKACTITRTARTISSASWTEKVSTSRR